MRFTVISSTAQVIYITVDNPILIEKFYSLLQRSDKGSTFVVQEYGDDFYNGLIDLKIYLGNNAGAFNGILAYFQRLSKCEKFAIIPEKIEDTQYLFSLQAQIDEMNGKPNMFNLGTQDIFTSIYNLACYGWQRKNIGQPIKSKRKCRFCGKSIPETTFEKKSHAISEALGNKKVVCLEECDCCNKYFGESIERDIINLFSPYRSLYKIKGKEGIPTSKGKNYKISKELSSFVLPFKSVEDLKSRTFVLDTSNYKFIPQNVYRCLCKYVLSVVNRKLLDKFTDTILWIKGNKEFNRLPLLGFCNKSGMIDEPYLYVFTRKTINNDYPLLVGCFFVGSIGIFFIVPEDKTNIDIQSESLFDLLKNHPEYKDLIRTDFSGNLSVTTNYTLSFQ